MDYIINNKNIIYEIYQSSIKSKIIDGVHKLIIDDMICVIKKGFENTRILDDKKTFILYDLIHQIFGIFSINQYGKTNIQKEIINILKDYDRYQYNSTTIFKLYNGEDKQKIMNILGKIIDNKKSDNIDKTIENILYDLFNYISNNSKNKMVNTTSSIDKINNEKEIENILYDLIVYIVNTFLIIDTDKLKRIFDQESIYCILDDLFCDIKMLGGNYLKWCCCKINTIKIYGLDKILK
jgi:hypothetical protein